MNFKDLLQRYNEGTATEEEKEVVEKELEKYEAIENHYSETLPDHQLFDREEFDSEDTIDNANETKDIKKVVNRRLGKVVLLSVLIVIILYIGIFHGLSSVVDSFYYDPTTVTQHEENQEPTSDFYHDMQAYISLNLPGHSTRSFTSQSSEGFGNYEVGYSLRDLFTNDNQQHFVNLSRGNLTRAFDGIFSIENRIGVWEGFRNIQNPLPEEASENGVSLTQDIQNQRNEISRTHLNDLNELSYVSMSMVFDQELTMEELHNLIRTYSDLEFKWAGIRTTEPETRWSDTDPMHLVGFNPNANDEPVSNRRPDPEEYPYFNLADAHGESPIAIDEFSEFYETHFHSRLSYLSDSEEFVELFDFNPNKTDFYNASLDYIEEHGIETYGVLVYGSAEDFLNHIDDMPYETLHINDVTASKPDIYTN